MAFTDAIPVNTVAQPSPRFDLWKRREQPKKFVRQSVNISKETTDRIAQEAHKKLSTKLKMKLVYNQTGNYSSSMPAGSLLSAKA